MYKRQLKFYAPDDSSVGVSTSELTLEQARQQAETNRRQYEELQAKITKGELVDPVVYVKQKVDAGELFQKDRYVGLQKTFQDAQDVIKTLEPKVKEFETNYSNLEEKFKAKETEVQERDQEIGKLKPKLARANIIFKEFPQLASFEADGLLPDAPEDKLPEIFKKFSEKLGSIKTAAGKEFLAGGGSTTPEEKLDPKLQTSQTHLKLANEAMAKNDMATYNKEYDLYLGGLLTQKP